MKSNWITREQIRANRLTHLYVYADDTTGKAHEGQAEQCAGEPNAMAVPTREWNCNDPRAQFNDAYFEDVYKHWIDKAFKEIREYRIQASCPQIIIILPKIGRGCSQMNVLAPRCFAYLLTRLQEIDPTYK